MRCDGRGFIEAGYAPVPRHAKKGKKTNKPPPSSPAPDSSYPALKSTSLMRTRAATPAPIKNCPLCNAQVREDRLQKHLSGRCPLRAGKTTIPARGAQQEECPACKFRGGTNEFTRHFAEAHGSKGRGREHRRIQVGVVGFGGISYPVSVGRPKKISGKKKKNNPLANPRHSMEKALPESLRYEGKVEAETPSWRNNLDATKNYGYPARESGRYGSHPSHDGIDDESKP
jgi:hypothetical protein